MIRPHIGMVRQKLFEQITVGRVDFHAVKAGQPGQFCGALVFLNDAGNFARFQSARHGTIFQHPGRDGRLPVAGNGAGCDRQFTIWLKIVVRHPAGVKKLQKHFPTRFMHGARHEFPTVGLCSRMNARHVKIAMSARRDRRGFGNDQAGGRALAIISRIEFPWNVAGHFRPHPRGRGHDDAVAQADCAKLKRGE